MSQDAIAKPHFTKSYISAVERNKVRPSLKALNYIAHQLGIPLHELLAQPVPLDETADLEAVEDEVAYQLSQADWLIAAARAEEALQIINQTQSTYQETFEDLGAEIRYRFYLLRGSAYLRLREPGSAREDLGTALQLAQQLEDAAEEVVTVRNLIGVAYYNQDVPRRAIEQHEQCLNAIREGVVSDLSLRLSIYSNLANDYRALGDMGQAVGVYREALEQLQDANSLGQISAIYRGLSLTYKASGDLERAEWYGGQALTILEATRNLSTAAELRMNLAAIATARGEFDEAAGLLAQAEELLGSKEDRLAWSALHEQYATLDLKRGNVEQAESYAGQSLALATRAFEGRGEYDLEAQARAVRAFARALRTSGLIGEVSGRRQEADENMQRALQVLAETQFAETISEVEFDYAELLAARGDHAAAGAHYRAAYQQRQKH